MKGRAVCLVCRLDVCACPEQCLCVSLQTHSFLVSNLLLCCRINVCISCITSAGREVWGWARDYELIFQRFLKMLSTFTGLKRKYLCHERNTWFPAQALSFCWHLNMKLTTKLQPNSILVSNRQTPSKFTETNPTTQHTASPSDSTHFCFLLSPQHFYKNLSLSSFPVLIIVQTF